jgi:HD-GYP domain-containing protein (c-di-GMP phosphodiesterase class II)
MQGHYQSTATRTSEQLRELHDRLLGMVAEVDRVSCALYDPFEDLLKTFVSSTRTGLELKGYEFKMSQSDSLSDLAASGGFRLIEDIPSTVRPDNAHSVYILNQGYQTSLTVPMYHRGAFAGFIFFDSLQPAAYTPENQQALLFFADLVSLIVYHELDSIRILTGVVSVSRAFCDMRDFETGAHLERMARFSRLIAREISDHVGISDEFVEHVYLFAPLHDLGKIGISDSILHKPGKLTEEEWSLMSQHPEKGLELLDMVLESFALSDIPDIDVARNIVLYHHEMLDGSGYPHGLKGEEVPLEARITATADIFDALTSRRPYKEPWPMDLALAELDRLVDLGKLDARCVDALKRHPDALQEICSHYNDASGKEA